MPKLYGVSAIGRRLYFYCLEKTPPYASVQPTGIARALNRLNDTAPIRLWDRDVLEDGGEQGLRAVVKETIYGCAGLIDDDDDDSDDSY